VILTNSTGQAPFNFDATGEGEYAGAPKFLVGEQQWKAELNDSLLDAYFNNDTSSFLSTSTSVQGDIILSFTNPDGSSNFTQEQIITFLGATTDDTGDALESTIIYNANTSENSFVCNDIIQIGANAFQCIFQTYLNTTRGYYNITMNANMIGHYDNLISNEGASGLFYIFPKKKLENPQGNAFIGSTADGWGSSNWNFSVIVSSGDPDNNLTTGLYMAQNINPATQCTGPTCLNQTTTSCNDCEDKTVSWLRNFTSSDIGTWYYQFKLDDTEITSTSGTDYSITVQEDATNISYGGAGNDSTVIYQTQAQTLSVKVYDIDKESFNVASPSATVTFKLLESGKILGSNTTNATGHATLYFNMSDCQYSEGTQVWVGEINSSDPNYNESISENFTITLDVTGCEATVAASDILTPTQTFQNQNFTINTTVSAFISNAENVFATLNIPSDWIIGNQTQSLGTIIVGTPREISWTINSTTYGIANVSVYSNSSNAGNDTESSSTFNTYKEFPSISTIENLPQEINPSSNFTASWSCNIGDYRAATLDFTANATTKIKIETYNGTNFVDIMHSKELDTSNNFESVSIPVLQNQLNSNEEGLCSVRITNVGINSINISDITLETYYNEAIGIQDIQVSVGGINTTGLETNDELLNISVKVTNSINESYLVNLSIDIINSTGYTVYSISNDDTSIGALSTIESNFLNIDTSTWNQDDYTISAKMLGNFTSATNRSEFLIFKNINIFADTVIQICDLRTEVFDVTINHPFTDTIQYNVSLEMPSGWSYSGYQLINISTIGNTSLAFNFTSSNAASENITINATINYVYPSASKERKANHSIEEGNNLPMLEVIRETPSLVSSSTEFVSNIILHNKGCADVLNSQTPITFIEQVPAGWVAFAPTIDGSSAGTADIPNGQIIFSPGDIDKIRQDDYRIISYKVLSPSGLAQSGGFRSNLTWGSYEEYESSAHTVETTTYINEGHLEFDLVAEGSWRDRSAEANANQTYNLSVKNIGDQKIINDTWEIKLSILDVCSAYNYTGAFNQTERTITWNLENLSVQESTYFDFVMSCSEIQSTTEPIMTVQGINNTISTTSYIDTTSTMGCSGSSCTDSDSYAFTKPTNPRYEKLTNLDFYTFYNWTDYAMTLGEGSLSFTDDWGNQRIAWQNYSFSDISGTFWSNYTVENDDIGNFVNTSREINIKSYTDGIGNKDGNVTLQKLAYTWQTGKVFNDTQDLFLAIHPFVFDLSTPILVAPVSESTQASAPVGLSWQAISASAGINITYYIFGDTIDASTLLTTTTDTLYLWSAESLGALQGTFYWKVIASDGSINKTSAIWQFDLDRCLPDASFGSYLTYPMSYNETIDTITIWGSNGTSYDAMGSNEGDAITFQQIYEFGRAKRGVCAITNPASGSYVVLSRLEFGNITDSLNTTFVKTIGESISFTKQIQLNFNSTFIAGSLSSEGSPFAGSTLSFSGVDAVDSNQGEFYTLSDSELRLYDTGVSHTVTANDSNPFGLYWNGEVKAKSSTLQNWYTIRLLGGNNSLEDIIFTDMGEGFYPATTQSGTLTTIKSRNIDTEGLFLFGDTNVTVTDLQISETAGDDIRVQNYTGIANLLNPVVNFSSINWTTGSFPGQINRKYEYSATTTDAVGATLPNVSMVLYDLRGDTSFDLITDSSGQISTQTVTRALYNYNFKTGDERGPHTLKVKKFGNNFASLAKQFSAATVETLQLNTNPFVSSTESQILDMTGIYYNAPTKVGYGDEINSSWGTSGTLANYPVTQSEFFSIFANGTKLIEGISNNYTIDYETGEITFVQDMTSYDITPVYSYGGNLIVATGTAVADCISMGDIYSYMQYNLSDTLTTVDGVAYLSYIDLIIGNSTTGGCIIDSSASLAFEDGYTYSFSALGGYIDLYGITSGGGSGGLPLNIFDDVGVSYEPGDDVYIFSTTLDSAGTLVSSVVNVIAYYPNGTTIFSGLSTEISIGRFRYNFTLSSSAPEGTYSIAIDATYEDNEIHDTLAFQVETEAAAYPTITLEVSSPIATTTTASIGALVTSSIGVPVDCENDLSATIINLAGGSVESSGSMTNFGTGMYNYSWVTPVDPSVFYVNTSCLISGINYTGFTLLSTQSTGAQATVDYNQIAQYVWEYTSRNLTYYNQSISENLQACLKDSQCSDWWINTTLTSIESTLNEINLTTKNIETDAQTLLDYFDCTQPNEVCTRLQNIVSNATETNEIVFYLNNSQIPQLQSDIDNIYSDTQWLAQNVATQSNITQVLNGISNLQSNISFIKNNMFYQGNATSAFLVDYIATPYAEPGARTELWVLTRDLLGNSKTVTNATCEIRKDETWIANATVDISSGGIHGYWNVSENLSSGAYYWNCTLTGSTLNIQVPFYISGAFEITSLSTSSPKYPDEAAVIEATFADQNGDAVTPDSIELTILQPPTYGTSWATGNKNDFTQIGNVWRYTNSIENSPTTGTYITQLTATYNGINASETMQFRIATGGPYMVVLDCPDSSEVGSNLYCDVIIEDEGEAATESTCDTWVDVDNDQEIDAGESQVQFSKETQPLEIVIQPVSLNIPSAHSTGSFIVRTLCSYANSGQPPSAASDFVSFTSAGVTPPEEPTGGGGGGGGGASTSTIAVKKDFLIDAESMQVSLSPGGTRQIEVTIENLWNDNMDFVIQNPKLKEFITISETEFTLASKTSKTIVFSFTAPEDIDPELYVGKIIITAEGIEKEILIALDIESFEALFDVKVEIPEKYRKVLPGKEVLASVNIINLGLESTNTTIEYIIQDENGVVIVEDQETIEIGAKIGLVKSLFIPEATPSGQYVFYVKVSYEDKIASSSAMFQVEKKFPWILITAIAVLALIIISSIFFLVFKKRKMKKVKPKKKKVIKRKDLSRSDSGDYKKRMSGILKESGMK
jgi:hypothetical protein